MTNNDQENIERKLNHVLEMGKKIIDLYPHVTCTERVALLLAMTAAVRQVAANIRTVAALLKQNLLDEFRINYTEYARSIENLHHIWEDELKGAPIFHNLDNQTLPITNPDEIVLKEDTDYSLSVWPSEVDGFDFIKTRVGLMENASLMCEAIDKGLGQISKTLRDIVSDYCQLKSDIEKQDSCLKTLGDYYESYMWEDDRDRFISEVEEYTEVSGDKTVNTYERYLKHLDREATDPHDIKILAELNEFYLGGGRPASFIVDNRDKLTIEDLARHFCFERCRGLLYQHIEKMKMMVPADNEYKNLFINRAAQEMAILLAPVIGNHVDFRFNYQYVALQMAMQDLDLIFRDPGNGVQMRDFINKVYLKNDDIIKDQKTLTEWTGKLLGHKFGEMDENNLVGNYALEDFTKLKNHYWLCLSIINKVVGKKLQESHFASYLFKEHDNTPSFTEYKNRQGEYIVEQLYIIKSAIKGERLFK